VCNRVRSPAQPHEAGWSGVRADHGKLKITIRPRCGCSTT
jgi:hypothetical protein